MYPLSREVEDQDRSDHVSGDFYGFVKQVVMLLAKGDGAEQQKAFTTPARKQLRWLRMVSVWASRLELTRL